MKKVYLTLSRLAALSAFGFAFAGACDNDEKEKVAATTTTGTAAVTVPAGLTTAQVDQMMNEKLSSHVIKLAPADFIAYMNDVTAKAALNTVIADHADLKAIKTSVKNLTDKEGELLKLVVLEPTLTKLATEKDPVLVNVLRNVCAVPRTTAEFEKAYAELKDCNYRGFVYQAANDLAHPDGAAAVLAIGGLNVNDYFIHKVGANGLPVLYKVFANVPGTVGVVTGNAVKEVRNDGTLGGFVAVGA